MCGSSSIVHELDVSYVERDLNALLSRIGHPRKPVVDKPLDIASIVLPSTPITEAATAAAKRMLDPALFNHSTRAYYISQILIHDHFPTWQVDNELLYTVCMLHDIGCSDQLQLNTRASFELHGAIVAHGIVKAAGGAEEQALSVAEAINKHGK
jgi:cyanamide hydratase